MNKPYDLHFDEPVKITKVASRHKYKLCSYPLDFCEEVYIYEFATSALVSQRYNHRPFYFDLIEIHTEREMFEIRFDVSEKQLFLIFLLEGYVCFATEDGTPITGAKPEEFFMSYFDKGSYLAQVEKGNMIGLALSISPLWVEEISDDFQHIKCLLYEYENNFKSYGSYHHGKLDNRVFRLLQNVLSFGKFSKGIMDGHIRKYISYILQHYNEMIDTKTRELPHRLMQYLDIHYQDKDLSNKQLAEIFSATEKTLIRQFKEELQMTPHQYYTRLRMDHARQLIEVDHRSIEEVYELVGYRNEKAFRIAYNKHWEGLR
ncbi:helix-turn-helix domain-containing protein [Chryseobacterium populi]|uniref:Transcriptional regulator containing an amidase domain and an AraC-type DNA-binding HTH domain n=1 Tax=Chryseobacterium populi TaxID=1144316 RepID=J3CM20_9FLAO|nr:helix-turn-helix domain-containing protein [Chryseobacterium populi]EJL74379.1 transcriptional regulator containing an amidase domain and an AraC-type DNA-binding HTH domain [Chryseobacterium populi]